MDLAAIALKGAAIGMKVAGNIKERVTLNLGRAGDYDPATDIMGAGGTHVQADALPFRRRNRQAPDDVNANTETLQIEAATLPLGTVITQQDTVTRATGLWQIVAVENPAGALWILDIRR